jgi:CubicO group peptidase (beta-lactamase class C family)
MTREFTAASDWTRRHVEAGRLPVAVLGIADSRGVLSLEAFGSDGARTAHVDDRFALYSVTKPLVALTAMRAVERGLLTADTPLVTALPGFAHPQITLGQLMSHTSGIADLDLGLGLGLDRNRDLDLGAGNRAGSSHGRATTLREAVERAPLEFVPGTARRYNNLAWVGAAALIEKATGVGLEESVAELAATVGASGMSFDTEGVHEIHGGERYDHNPSAVLAMRHPAAGIAARAEDLLAVGQSLLAEDGAIVAPGTLDAMRISRTAGLYAIDPDPDEVFSGFGLGWNLPRRPGLIDHSVYGHSGWTRTQFWMSQATGLCVVLLTNRLDAAEPDVGVNFDELHNAVFSSR